MLYKKKFYQFYSQKIKNLQQLAANSESSIHEEFLLHVPTIYREISQQVADQLEKKDFSP